MACIADILEHCDEPNSKRLRYKRVFVGSEFGNALR